LALVCRNEATGYETNRVFYKVEISRLSFGATVRVANLLVQLIRHPGFENWKARFSGNVMTGHLSKISPATLIASGFARVSSGQVRATITMVERH
jgi:hypothetical protein